MSVPNLDFGLGETADAIRETTARFAADRIAPLAARIDAEDWFPRELWPEMGALGLHGITVEEADGGLDRPCDRIAQRPVFFGRRADRVAFGESVDTDGGVGRHR